MEQNIKKAVSRALYGCETITCKLWKYNEFGIGHADDIKKYVLPDGKILSFTAICRDVENYGELHGLTLKF